jgi:hypothetical protein
VGLGRHAGFQRELDRAEDGLFVVLEDEGEDLDHLPVASRALEQGRLQLPEGIGHLQEGGSVAQGSRLALDHRQVVTPVIDRPPGQMMGPLDDPLMLAQDPALGRHDDPVRIDPQADRAVDDQNMGQISVEITASLEWAPGVGQVSGRGFDHSFGV